MTSRTLVVRWLSFGSSTREGDILGAVSDDVGDRDDFAGDFRNKDKKGRQKVEDMLSVA
jgi:hypothetical protein